MKNVKPQPITVQLCEKIAKRVMREMQQLKAPLLSSDERLHNVWDEICVQTQDEYSYYWDMYEAAIYTSVEAQIKALKIEAQECDEDECGFCQCDPALCTDEKILRYITSEVLSLAMNYTNQRIENYLS